MFSVEQINRLRAAEIELVLPHLAGGHRIVELGAGTGQQAQRLTELGYRVEAFDLPASTYSEDVVFPVQRYDGQRIPVDAGCIDVVYTSNVLEHVRDATAMHREIRRILRPGGRAVHVMPSHTWRAWTTATAIPDGCLQLVTLPTRLTSWYPALRSIVSRLLPRRHGEQGNIVSETWLFHPRAWVRELQRHRFNVVDVQPMGMFYTGNMLLGERLSIDQRRRLAAVLGSASYVFVATPR